MKTSLDSPITSFFSPRYNEITLFLMSLTFILLFCTDATLRSESHDLLFHKFDLRNYMVIVIFAAGMLSSLYHIFTPRVTTRWEKTAMLFFAIFVNSLSGIAAGLHMLKGAESWLMLFPLWNIINGVILIIMLRFDLIDEDNIVIDKVNPFQAVLGSIVVVAAVVLCRFYFEMYWAITFSICVSYATNINGTLHDIFRGREKEHIDSV